MAHGLRQRIQFEGVRRLAQMDDDESAKVVVPYRAKPEQKAALMEVYKEESKARRPDGKRLTLSRVIGFVVGLGLDLYWVRHGQGANMDGFAAENGMDRRSALTELIKRGLERRKK